MSRAAKQIGRMRHLLQRQEGALRDLADGRITRAHALWLFGVFKRARWWE